MGSPSPSSAPKLKRSSSTSRTSSSQGPPHRRSSSSISLESSSAGDHELSYSSPAKGKSNAIIPSSPRTPTTAASPSPAAALKKRRSSLGGLDDLAKGLDFSTSSSSPAHEEKKLHSFLTKGGGHKKVSPAHGAQASGSPGKKSPVVPGPVPRATSSPLRKSSESSSLKKDMPTSPPEAARSTNGLTTPKKSSPLRASLDSKTLQGKLLLGSPRLTPKSTKGIVQQSIELAAADALLEGELMSTFSKKTPERKPSPSPSLRSSKSSVGRKLTPSPPQLGRPRARSADKGAVAHVVTHPFELSRPEMQSVTVYSEYEFDRDVGKKSSSDHMGKNDDAEEEEAEVERSTLLLASLIQQGSAGNDDSIISGVSSSMDHEPTSWLSEDNVCMFSSLSQLPEPDDSLVLGDPPGIKPVLVEEPITASNGYASTNGVYDHVDHELHFFCDMLDDPADDGFAPQLSSTDRDVTFGSPQADTFEAELRAQIETTFDSPQLSVMPVVAVTKGETSMLSHVSSSAGDDHESTDVVVEAFLHSCSSPDWQTEEAAPMSSLESADEIPLVVEDLISAPVVKLEEEGRRPILVEDEISDEQVVESSDDESLEEIVEDSQVNLKQSFDEVAEFQSGDVEEVVVPCTIGQLHEVALPTESEFAPQLYMDGSQYNLDQDMKIFEEDFDAGQNDAEDLHTAEDEAEKSLPPVELPVSVLPVTGVLKLTIEESDATKLEIVEQTPPPKDDVGEILPPEENLVSLDINYNAEVVETPPKDAPGVEIAEETSPQDAPHSPVSLERYYAELVGETPLEDAPGVETVEETSPEDAPDSPVSLERYHAELVGERTLEDGATDSPVSLERSHAGLVGETVLEDAAPDSPVSLERSRAGLVGETPLEDGAPDSPVSLERYQYGLVGETPLEDGAPDSPVSLERYQYGLVGEKPLEDGAPDSPVSLERSHAGLVGETPLEDGATDSPVSLERSHAGLVGETPLEDGAPDSPVSLERSHAGLVGETPLEDGAPDSPVSLERSHAGLVGETPLEDGAPDSPVSLERYHAGLVGETPLEDAPGVETVEEKSREEAPDSPVTVERYHAGSVGETRLEDAAPDSPASVERYHAELVGETRLEDAAPDSPASVERYDAGFVGECSPPVSPKYHQEEDEEHDEVFHLYGAGSDEVILRPEEEPQLNPVLFENVGESDSDSHDKDVEEKRTAPHDACGNGDSFDHEEEPQLNPVLFENVGESDSDSHDKDVEEKRTAPHDARGNGDSFDHEEELQLNPVLFENVGESDSESHDKDVEEKRTAPHDARGNGDSFDHEEEPQLNPVLCENVGESDSDSHDKDVEEKRTPPHDACGNGDSFDHEEEPQLNPVLCENVGESDSDSHDKDVEEKRTPPHDACGNGDSFDHEEPSSNAVNGVNICNFDYDEDLHLEPSGLDTSSCETSGVSDRQNSELEPPITLEAEEVEGEGAAQDGCNLKEFSAPLEADDISHALVEDSQTLLRSGAATEEVESNAVVGINIDTEEESSHGDTRIENSIPGPEEQMKFDPELEHQAGVSEEHQAENSEEGAELNSTQVSDNSFEDTSLTSRDIEVTSHGDEEEFQEDQRSSVEPAAAVGVDMSEVDLEVSPVIVTLEDCESASDDNSVHNMAFEDDIIPDEFGSESEVISTASQAPTPTDILVKDKAPPFVFSAGEAPRHDRIKCEDDHSVVGDVERHSKEIKPLPTAVDDQCDQLHEESNGRANPTEEADATGDFTAEELAIDEASSVIISATPFLSGTSMSASEDHASLTEDGPEVEKAPSDKDGDAEIISGHSTSQGGTLNGDIIPDFSWKSESHLSPEDVMDNIEKSDQDTSSLDENVDDREEDSRDNDTVYLNDCLQNEPILSEDDEEEVVNSNGCASLGPDAAQIMVISGTAGKDEENTLLEVEDTSDGANDIHADSEEDCSEEPTFLKDEDLDVAGLKEQSDSSACIDEEDVLEGEDDVVVQEAVEMRGLDVCDVQNHSWSEVESSVEEDVDEDTVVYTSMESGQYLPLVVDEGLSKVGPAEEVNLNGEVERAMPGVEEAEVNHKESLSDVELEALIVDEETRDEEEDIVVSTVQVEMVDHSPTSIAPDVLHGNAEKGDVEEEIQHPLWRTTDEEGEKTTAVEVEEKEDWDEDSTDAEISDSEKEIQHPADEGGETLSVFEEESDEDIANAGTSDADEGVSTSNGKLAEETVVLLKDQENGESGGHVFVPESLGQSESHSEMEDGAMTNDKDSEVSGPEETLVTSDEDDISDAEQEDSTSNGTLEEETVVQSKDQENSSTGNVSVCPVSESLGHSEKMEGGDMTSDKDTDAVEVKMSSPLVISDEDDISDAEQGEGTPNGNGTQSKDKNHNGNGNGTQSKENGSSGNLLVCQVPGALQSDSTHYMGEEEFVRHSNGAKDENYRDEGETLALVKETWITSSLDRTTHHEDSPDPELPQAAALYQALQPPFSGSKQDHLWEEQAEAYSSGGQGTPSSLKAAAAAPPPEADDQIQETLPASVMEPKGKELKLHTPLRSLLLQDAHMKAMDGSASANSPSFIRRLFRVKSTPSRAASERDLGQSRHKKSSSMWVNCLGSPQVKS